MDEAETVDHVLWGCEFAQKNRFNNLILYYILASKLKRVYNFGWKNNSIVFMVAFYGVLFCLEVVKLHL